MNVGEVWLVDFPFEDDLTQSKIRPCVVMDIDTLKVLSLKITKHRPRNEFDIPIFKWQQANLPLPSFARVSKTMLIPKSSFIRKCGVLDVVDFQNITRAFIKFHSEM